MAMQRTPAPGGAAGHAPDSVRMQILATEHWSLLASRSMAYSEAFSRAGMFLSVLSGAVVALALVAQATDFGEGFDLFAIFLLPVVAFIGLATFVRLVQVNTEDVQWVLGINRLRHAYVDLDPSIGRYFVTAWHDDDHGMLMSIASGTGGSTMFHGFITTPGMLAVVDGAVCAILAGFAAIRLGVAPVVAMGVGTVTFVVLVTTLMRYQAHVMTAARKAYRPQFPHSADPPELQTDDQTRRTDG